MKDTKKDMMRSAMALGLLSVKPCTPDETDAVNTVINNGGKLPQGIIKNDDLTYSKCEFAEMSSDEVNQYLQYKNTLSIREVKRITYFLLYGLAAIIVLLLIIVAELALK